MSLDVTSGSVRVRVGPGVEIDSDKPTLDLLEQLRSRWKGYLDQRISRPKPTDWSNKSFIDSSEFALPRAILQFVTAEDGSGPRPPVPQT